MTETGSGPGDAKPLGEWTGAFGDRYTERNAATQAAVLGRAHIWGPLLARMAPDPPTSILEIGANLGLNLRALSTLTDAALFGLEPNASARAALAEDGVLAPERILTGFGHAIPLGDGAVDLAFTTGVLIHVHPDLLERTLREIHRVSRKYIFCAEYFANKPEAIDYRGEQGLLFKDDFGGRYLDLFADLELVDVGFFWKRATVMDDCVWQLFRKKV